MNRIFIFFTLSVLISLTSCASAKQNGWLKAHQMEINRMAESNVASEEKMDVLLTRYAILMEEGLRFVDPVKGVKYIEKFQTQNEAAINKIVGQSSSWIGKLNTGETLMFGTRIAQKPYINRYVELVPKFHRKYEQYKFVLGMTSKIAGGFGKLGSKIVTM